MADEQQDGAKPLFQLQPLIADGRKFHVPGHADEERRFFRQWRLGFGGAGRHGSHVGLMSEIPANSARTGPFRPPAALFR
jgi:hypothetical protein